MPDKPVCRDTTANPSPGSPAVASGHQRASSPNPFDPLACGPGNRWM